jgi:ATP-binding cassette, subfamily B, bacterial MsbA
VDGQSDLSLLWRLFRYGWRYRGRLAVMLIATTAMAATSAYLVVVTKSILDLQAAEAADAAKTMLDIAIRLAALTPVAAASFYIAWTSGQWLANRCVQELRGDLISHLVRLELAFHSSLSRGDLLSRLTSDVAAVQILFQNLFGKVLQRPAEAIGTVGALFWIDWRLASIVFLFLVPLAALIARLLRRIRKRSRKARQRLAENVVAMEQITSGIRVIKAMGSADAERQRYADANQNLFEANMRLARSRAQTDATTNAAIFGGLALALLGMSYILVKGWSDVGSLLLFLGALGRLTNLMRTGTRSYGEIQENLPAAERVFAILDRPNDIADRADAVDCLPPSTAITFEHVSFRYAHDSEEVLRDVDLVIPIGKTVALVGESGAGKSTMLDLIPRFREVTGGRITIDGVDVRNFRNDSLVRHFAIVQQDNFLFNDTVYNNIRYGRPAATRAEIETAAKRAHVHETILSLEGGLGYETIVGDRGERLSGGQRQRVAIARALLRDAPVLLLDEPTSALDADSERHVQEALLELMKGRTSIVVAHRLSTIQHADIIFVLSRKTGAVVESGTHRELVVQGGEYARLVKIQQLA